MDVGVQQHGRGVRRWNAAASSRSRRTTGSRLPSQGSPRVCRSVTSSIRRRSWVRSSTRRTRTACAASSIVRCPRATLRSSVAARCPSNLNGRVRRADAAGKGACRLGDRAARGVRPGPRGALVQHGGGSHRPGELDRATASVRPCSRATSSAPSVWPSASRPATCRSITTTRPISPYPRHAATDERYRFRRHRRLPRTEDHRHQPRLLEGHDTMAKKTRRVS